MAGRGNSRSKAMLKGITMPGIEWNDANLNSAFLQTWN